MNPHRALVRRRVRQLLPFLFALTVAFGFLVLPPEPHRTTELLLVLAISAGVTAVIAAPWHRLPRVCQVLPAMAFLPVIMILRDMEGGASSGYAALLVLPLLWLALYSGGAAVAIAVAGVAAALVTPIPAGDPRYPSSEWRSEDFLARYGGDEFAVLLPGCPLPEAVVVIDRLRASTPGTTCSCGVAEWVPGEPELDLLHRADQRLYAAKRAGGATVVAELDPLPVPT
jgi:hypothetical protein